MKIWKMVGCLGLLVVIICGCVVLGNPTKVAAQEGIQEQTGQEHTQEEREEEQTAETSTGNTATVNKTYSTGLLFRSNGDGTCAVSGIGTCTAACILIPPQSPNGDTVTEILAGAFSGSVVGAIELPATITTLSAASFAGCERLGYIRVASANTCFVEQDGVLYANDGKVLVYCPAGHSGKELRLHPNLRRIAAGAVAVCPNLSTVYFSGTTAEWHSVIVGDDNDALYRAGLQFGA